MPQRKSIEEIHALLDGPVNSIPTPFTKDGELDIPGAHKIIETGIQGGSTVSLLTYGDSRFDYLSDDEVTLLTKVMVEQSAGRALTVAAHRSWWTGRTVEFAQYCVALGVDMLMLMPGFHMRLLATDMPDFYRSVAKIIPVMLIVYGDMPFLDALQDEPNICCVKEDSSVEDAWSLLRRYGQRWKVMTGGTLYRHYAEWPYGCRAFMSWPHACIPDFANRYWQAVQANDDATIQQIIRVEHEIFDYSNTFPGGWQSLWRAMLEINGIASRYQRSPDVSAADADLETLREKLVLSGIY